VEEVLAGRDRGAARDRDEVLVEALAPREEGGLEESAHSPVIEAE
jgi:hypothetical protein